MESYDERHSDHAMSASIADALKIQNPSLRTDSQIKYGLLGRGDAQLFLRFPAPEYRCSPTPQAEYHTTLTFEHDSAKSCVAECRNWIWSTQMRFEWFSVVGPIFIFAKM